MEYSVSTEQQFIFMGIQEQMTYFKENYCLTHEDSLKQKVTPESVLFVSSPIKILY